MKKYMVVMKNDYGIVKIFGIYSTLSEASQRKALENKTYAYATWIDILEIEWNV